MSVWDREPDVPNDDNGKGLRLIGWLLLIWDGISLVWVPSNQVMSSYLPSIRWTMFILGAIFVGWGFMTARREPMHARIDETAHDMMVRSHSGAQNDEAPRGEHERGLPPNAIGYDPELQMDVAGSTSRTGSEENSLRCRQLSRDIADDRGLEDADNDHGRDGGIDVRRRDVA